MDKTNMLIDFSSPARKVELVQPLIPVPSQIQDIAPLEDVGEPSVDPFEVQETGAPDPFEVVIQSAANNVNGKPSLVKNPQITLECKTENILINIQSEDNGKTETSNLNIPEIKVDLVTPSSNDDVMNKTPLKSDEISARNKIPEYCKSHLENSHSTTAVNKNAHIEDTLKNSSKSSIATGSDIKSPITVDFSTEESLKAVIAKRVSRCIQETLNGSKNKSCSSLFKKPQNQRSLSFIGLSSTSVKKECDRLNKSCTDVNDCVNLENQRLNNSSESSGFELLSQDSTDASTEGIEEDKVFKEARKLSRTFSRLADSFRQEQESDSDDEDLMSCRPRWLYTDSSEDEGEKLLKDPALNFRRRSTVSVLSSPARAPSDTKAADSPALLAYKSRRSFTHQQEALDNTQEERTIKRSISMGSKLKEVPVIPTRIAPGSVNLLKTDNQPLKLKKNFGEVKKGPLRAVMPIQSMMKEPLQVPGKIVSKQDTSPEGRIQKTELIMETPNKDDSKLNIPPIASSTPNKDESFVSSKSNGSMLLKPVAPGVVNKRHSLEGNVGSHKSREVVPGGGARPRSNSANSSIPRVTQMKPLRGLLLTPKSTSNLQRPANTRIHANNVPEKSTTSHFKTGIKKTRVLTDVKSKSPIQVKVRTAVNTISSLVRGKRSAARDKENRVPA